MPAQRRDGERRADDPTSVAVKETGLSVENAVQDLGGRPVGGNRVAFRVSNRTREPAEVVGFTEGCQGGCCFFLTDSARRPISAGESIEVVGMLSVSEPGPFEFVGEMYLRDGEMLKTVRLKVVGMGLPEGSKNEDRP